MKTNMKIIRPDVIDDLWMRQMYTPDVQDLSMYDNHLIFLFDGLKSSINGHQNMMFLRDSKYLGRAITVRKEFIMKQNGFPIVQVKKQANQKKSVAGEVYAVSTNTLMRLDALYDNTNKQLRCQEYVELLDQSSPTKTPQHPVVQSYMYIADDYFWDKAAATWMPGHVAFREAGWFWDFRDARKATEMC